MTTPTRPAANEDRPWEWPYMTGIGSEIADLFLHDYVQTAEAVDRGLVRVGANGVVPAGVASLCGIPYRDMARLAAEEGQVGELARALAIVAGRLLEVSAAASYREIITRRRPVASLHLRPADRDQESEAEEAIVERSLPERDA